VSQSKETVGGTLLVAFILCVVCSAIVATAAVMLKPKQTAAKENDRSLNILQIAGLYDDNKPLADQMSQVKARVINLDTGKFTDELTVAQAIDPKKLARDASKITKLDSDSDKAKLIRRENFGVVYIVEKDGQLDRVILPIRGYGLWSTLWGFVALQADLNTVIGLGYYQHAETPGLGGEVDNPKWKALWPGKKLFDGDEVAIKIIKGTVDPTQAGAEYQVDGLSGATLTSNGVHNMLHFWLGQQGYGPFLKNLKAGGA